MRVPGSWFGASENLHDEHGWGEDDEAPHETDEDGEVGEGDGAKGQSRVIGRFGIEPHRARCHGEKEHGQTAGETLDARECTLVGSARYGEPQMLVKEVQLQVLGKQDVEGFEHLLAGGFEEAVRLLVAHAERQPFLGQENISGSEIPTGN